MYSAIVLDEPSRLALHLLLSRRHVSFAEQTHQKTFCHHVTLAMGNRVGEGYTLGERVEFVADAFGEVAGRVVAVRALGVSRRDGKTPHVTLATFGDAKPRESNDVTLWRPLGEPMPLAGTVELCQ